MPIYEYRCSECEERFEKLVRLGTSTSEIECPKCGGQRVEKLISAFCARLSSATAVAPAAACSTPT